ncbi:MAG: serine hydrolase [Parasphingorhabdus sp.]|uniref:serine hydrolase domain-containing protein n=1 Tax=Parasphingorhabdus sp. TaxID=2709688 RepID=UPI0032988DAD
MKWLVKTILLSQFLAMPVTAQTSSESSDYDRALAAGYKAQFICSGLWNGGKSLADIEADELTGIYDRVEPIIPDLTTEIDQEKRQVRVSFNPDLEPRIAFWNPLTGCTAMPIGSAGLAFSKPPKLRTFQDERAWPYGDRNAAIDPAQLPKPVQQLHNAAFDTEKYGGKTSGFLIIQNGKILLEGYKNGHDMHTAQRTWSVAKSMAGTLIGHSVEQGFSDVHAPAKIMEWMSALDPRREITLDQLLRMSSGLTSDTAGNRTDPIYMGGATVTQRAVNWPLLYPPGSRFRYANNDTLLAVHAARSGAFDPFDFFQKIGMTRTYAETDWQNNYILSSQVWTTARDLGRMGMLYLNNGMWGGKRLLPENWRKYVSSPSGPQPDREFGYGASFWLMNKSDGIPKDTFAAFGNRGQFLVIIPSRDLVIVRRGYDTRDNRFDIAGFSRDIIEATNP